MTRGRGRIIRLSICAVLTCVIAELVFFTAMSLLLQSRPTVPPQTHHFQRQQTDETSKEQMKNLTQSVPLTVTSLAVLNAIETQGHAPRYILNSTDHLPNFVHEKYLPSRDNLTYIRALREWAGPGDVIVLAFVDDGVLDMTFNLIETSLMKHAIRNVLFISSSATTCASLESRGFPCLLFQPIKSSGSYSKFNSKDFVEKMKRRSHFIIETLTNGFNVLLTDVDVVYVKNPFEYLATLRDFDIAPLEDKPGTLNAGFLFIKATKASIELYKRMNRLASHNPTLGEQVRFNLAVKKMQSDFTTSSLRVSILAAELFQSGRSFWEVGQRAFFTDSPCNECVVIHDNFVIGHEAKVWRLKEMHMWMYDEKGYYSCTTCKYLKYHNPLWFGSPRETTQREMEALRSALLLGIMLDRYVIMPRFHGPNGKQFLSLQNVVKLDPLHKHLRQIIRENSFLAHPKVGGVVKKNIMETTVETLRLSEGDRNTTDVSPLPEYQNGVTMKHIDEFKSFKETILSFRSLYSIKLNARLLRMTNIDEDVIESVSKYIMPYVNV